MGLAARDELRELVRQLPPVQRERALTLIDFTDDSSTLISAPVTMYDDIADWIVEHEWVSARALGRRFRIRPPEAEAILRKARERGLLGEPEADSYPVHGSRPRQRTFLDERGATAPWRPWRWR